MDNDTLLQRMLGGEFIIIVEVMPPLPSFGFEFRRAMDQLKSVGVESVGINSSRGGSEDDIHLSMALSRQGFEAIPHIITRQTSLKFLLDRVFEAYFLGRITNFLIITGDPILSSDSKVIDEIRSDSVAALTALDRDFRGSDLAFLDFTLAAAVNQNTPDLDREGRRIQDKELAGADFFMSQPVFDKTQAQEVSGFYRKWSDAPLVLGVWPLLHGRMVERIYCGGIPGVVMPSEIYEKAHGYINEVRKLRRWSAVHTSELIEFIRTNSIAQGVYIVSPRNPLFILELLKAIL